MRFKDEEQKVAQPSGLVRRDAEAMGLEVRQARRHMGMDQDALAFAAHVSPRTVFAIEKGKPTVRMDMLVRVLAAVGLKLTTLPRDRVWAPPSPPGSTPSSE